MMRTGLLILAIPSIVLLFLPYTSGVSPWETVLGKWGGLALLGGPFFLSIPILIAQTRMLLKRPFSRGERATYRLLTCAALAAGLAFLGLLLWNDGYSEVFIRMGFYWGIPCVAVVWMMILSARKLNPEDATTVTLQAAWLPNAIWCAIAFWNGWEIGARLAAFSIVVYTVEIALSMRRNRRTPCLDNRRLKGGIISDGERPLSASG
jgi:hypothetical protein